MDVVVSERKKLAAHHLASDYKYASVHRMHMATQPFMLPARMATIRYVLGVWEEGGRKWLVVTGRRREDEQSKMQPLRVSRVS